MHDNNQRYFIYINLLTLFTFCLEINLIDNAILSTSCRLNAMPESYAHLTLQRTKNFYPSEFTLRKFGQKHQTCRYTQTQISTSGDL